MKRISHIFLPLVLLCISTGLRGEQTYRIEIGYNQPYQVSEMYRNTYFHGGKIGGTVDFLLPYNMSIQTGLFYNMAYAKNEQHFTTSSENGKEYVMNRLWLHQMNIPVRYTYTQKIWSKLALFAYGGPDFQIGLANIQDATSNLSAEKIAYLESLSGTSFATGKTDLYSNGTLRRFNFMLGVGGGIQWDKYRLQSGYDLGMFSISKDYKVHQRGWYVSFSYAF